MGYTDLLKGKPPKGKKKAAVKPDPSTAVSSPRIEKLGHNSVSYYNRPTLCNNG